MNWIRRIRDWLQRRRLIREMWQAARRGDRVKMLELIDTEFDVKTLGRSVPLMAYAASWNDEELIDRLIAKGVSLAHRRNCWVLFKAVENRNYRLIQWAGSAGLDVNKGSPKCQTPLGRVSV